VPEGSDIDDDEERARLVALHVAKAIQTLSAGLAHEIRNPLNAAKLQLELLERRIERDGADPKLLEPIGHVRSEIDRLGRLLSEFLAFARPPELVRRDHDVAALARNVVAHEQALAAQRGLTLELAVPELTGFIDSRSFQQILQHLVRNALEAARSHVTVAIDGDDRHLALHVEDDGPGIPDQVRARMFEPFFTTKDHGTGLGMSIVHSMVTLYGGTIAIASRPTGTRCDVTLPLRADP